MVSFDVKSLFTNVPLEYTIDLILKRIYDNGELSTDITRSEMKEMLPLCTKNVHFTFNGDIYLQTDGVAMGSPLGPVLAGIFMVQLERSLVPVLIGIRFALRARKEELLRSLVQRAHLICSTEDLLKTELNHIQKAFLEINDFPLWVTKQIFAEAEQKYKHQNIDDKDSNVINLESENRRHLLVLPYQGEQGSRLVKSLKRSITKLLPEATQLEFGFTGSKLSTHFQIKDKRNLSIIMILFTYERVQRTIAQIIMLVKAHVVSLRE